MLRPPAGPPDRGPRLPRRLRRAIDAHRAELLAAAPHPPVELSALADAAEPRDGPSLTAVLGVCALAAADDPAALLGQARAALAPGGRLLLLEPYRRTRLAGRLADLTAPLLHRSTRLRPNVAVPHLVRRAGFVIASVERVTMPTLIAPLRSFCRIVAEPASLPGAPGGATDGEPAR